MQWNKRPRHFSSFGSICKIFKSPLIWNSSISFVSERNTMFVTPRRNSQVIFCHVAINRKPSRSCLLHRVIETWYSKCAELKTISDFSHAHWKMGKTFWNCNDAKKVSVSIKSSFKSGMKALVQWGWSWEVYFGHLLHYVSIEQMSRARIFK